MNLTIRYFKYFLLIVGLLSSFSSFSESVTWTLSFADETGKEVGTGQITYDPETSKDIKLASDRYIPSDVEYTEDSLTVAGVKTGIDSISVKFLGEAYHDKLFDYGFDYIDFPPRPSVILEKAWWDTAVGTQILGVDDSGPNVLDTWTLWGSTAHEDGDFSQQQDTEEVDTTKRLDFTFSDISNSGDSIIGDWSLKHHIVSLDVLYDGFYHIGAMYSSDEEQSSGTVTATLVTDQSCGVAQYTPSTGEVSISTLDIEGKPYNVVLKKTGGYDFTILKIWRDRSGDDCQQAQYISNKGIIDIPVLEFNGKKYKVMMKKKSGYDFVIKHISRIR